MPSLIKKEIVCEVHPKDHFDELKITIFPTYGKSYQKKMIPYKNLIYGCLIEFDQVKEGEVYYKIESFRNQQKIKSYSPTYTQFSTRRGLQHINYQQHPFQLIQLSPLYQVDDQFVFFIHSRIKGEGQFFLTTGGVQCSLAKLILDHPTQNIYRLAFDRETFHKEGPLNLTFKNQKQSTHVDIHCSLLGNGAALNIKELPPRKVQKKKKFYLQVNEFKQNADFISEGLDIYDGVILPPPFLSKSHHGYDAIDYERPHQNLKSWQAYGEMISNLKRAGMTVIQDFNINHGHKDNIRSKDAHFTHNPPRHWSEDESLVEYDFSKENVTKFFLKLKENFKEQYGVDKFRIDCGNELPVDFYKASPEDFIYETWHYPSKALNEMGVQNLNYTFLWGFLTHLTESPTVFYRLLCETLAGHFQTDMSLNLNYLSSHDTEMFLKTFGEDTFFKGLTLLAFLPGDCILYDLEILKLESKADFVTIISAVRDFCPKNELPEMKLNRGQDLSLRSGELTCLMALSESGFCDSYEESFTHILVKRKGLLIGKR